MSDIPDNKERGQHMGNSYQGWDTQDEKRHISKYDLRQLEQYCAVMRKRVNWGDIRPTSVFAAAEQRLFLLSKKKQQ